MGINKNDATSFEDMANEMEAKATEATEPVTTDEVVETEPTQEGDKPCNCENCDCKNTEEV